MRHDMAGKVAIVTGGARGIGLGLATAFVAAGAAVVLTDILVDQGETAAAALNKQGGKVHFVRHDVTSEADWETATRAAVTTFGGLDYLVNNAGIETASLIVDLVPADIRRIFDVNILGVMLGTKYAFRVMRPGGEAGKGGAIVNIASAAAVMQGAGLSAYAVSKAGIAHFTRNAATEAGALDYGIRSNCIMPGLTETNMARQLGDHFAALGLIADEQTMRSEALARIPLKRYADVAEMASVALFLCSDAASYVSGACFPVDGAYSLV